jgi:hypothetical protein
VSSAYLDRPPRGEAEIRRNRALDLGRRARHRQFGLGTVRGISLGLDRKLRRLVQFDATGIRWVDDAELEPLAEDGA